MKFYNRKEELEILREADKLKHNHSIMTLIVGRRRIGKTTLSLRAIQNSIYFFVSKKDESLLCEEFVEELRNRGFNIFGEFRKFETLFEFVLNLSKTKPLTLIIDEFQDFYKINPSIFSSLQKLWDINKNSAHVHFIICGSIYTLMKKIFEDSKEPLFARADFKINLKPLTIPVLKEILMDYNSYSPDNLLDFYTISGGVAKYVELFSIYNTFTLESIIEKIISPFSLFLGEGKNRLIEEFGKDYTTYFSILSLIASSKTSRAEIEGILKRNISGFLDRLEKDYNIIKPIKPINAKPNSKLQKYEIEDNFLNFWFRFFYKYQSVIESENFDGLKQIILRDFNSYRGKFLEKMFIELLKLSGKWTKIGKYWERGNKNEIDIVAIDEINKNILISEVKLKPERLNKNKLILKSQRLIKQFSNYNIEFKLLSLNDIELLIPA